MEVLTIVILKQLLFNILLPIYLFLANHLYIGRTINSPGQNLQFLVSHSLEIFFVLVVYDMLEACLIFDHVAFFQLSPSSV